MSAGVKNALLTAGAVVGTIVLMQQFGATRNLLNGEADPVATFWNR